jgi:hypothetical protein
MSLAGRSAESGNGALLLRSEEVCDSDPVIPCRVESVRRRECDLCIRSCTGPGVWLADTEREWLRIALMRASPVGPSSDERPRGGVLEREECTGTSVRSRAESCGVPGAERLGGVGGWTSTSLYQCTLALSSTSSSSFQGTDSPGPIIVGVMCDLGAIVVDVVLEWGDVVSWVVGD